MEVEAPPPASEEALQEGAPASAVPPAPLEKEKSKKERKRLKKDKTSSAFTDPSLSTEGEDSEGVDGAAMTAARKPRSLKAVAQSGLFTSRGNLTNRGSGDATERKKEKKEKKAAAAAESEPMETAPATDVAAGEGSEKSITTPQLIAPPPPDDPNAPDDLASLAHLNNDAVLDGVKNRYDQNKIYTNINTLLIAMNPYKWLPIYGVDMMQKHSTATAGTVEPHVYGTAAAAYTGLLSSKSQSIVISGESGAGKSETAKKVLQHLAWAATKGGTTGGAGIEARILASNPIMEAFGNAKTSMNNNSSRYGKFLMLQFDLSGRLVGALINTYLLEKSRVVLQGPMERNYHIFFSVCAAPSIKEMLSLPTAADLQYTGMTGALESPGWDDIEVRIWRMQCGSVA